MKARAALLVLACLPGAAGAADSAWPPAPESQARIEALRRTLGDAASTAAERAAAREELVRLLMHPGAKERPAIDPMAPRSAIEVTSPLPSPAAASPATPPVTPLALPDRAPMPVPDPRGGIVVPSGKNVIDPKTGALLIDTGNGWVDPATGRFVPKN